MFDRVWIIKELHLDRLENDPDRAMWRETIGYFTTKIDAVRFCEKGKTFTNTDCWAISGKEPQFDYQEIKQLK